MTIGMFRVCVQCEEGELWTEPLTWMDALSLASIYLAREKKPVIEINTRRRHREIESLFALASPMEIGTVHWGNDCSCGKCTSAKGASRFVLVPGADHDRPGSPANPQGAR